MPIEQSNFNELPLNNKNAEEAEIFCQKCGVNIGSYKVSEGDAGQKSHGICEKCRDTVIVSEFDELKELIISTAKKIISIIEDPDLEPVDKIKSLYSEKLFIENNSLIDLTENNLEAIKIKLIEKFGL